MRIALIVASVLALSVSAALAADDVMANFYGNTVVATGGMADSKTYYRADHTFETKIATYDLKGTWAIDATGQLCRTYETPPPGMPNPLCVPIASHKVGDTWTVQMNGQTRNVTLVQGIQ
jgi:hypothetical protein